MDGSAEFIKFVEEKKRQGLRPPQIEPPMRPGLVVEDASTPESQVQVRLNDTGEVVTARSSLEFDWQYLQGDPVGVSEEAHRLVIPEISRVRRRGSVREYWAAGRSERHLLTMRLDPDA